MNYTDPTGHWEKGDENLSQTARIEISRLTDLYYSANTQKEKDAIHKAADDIRNNSSNKASTQQNSVTGKKANDILNKTSNKDSNGDAYMTGDEWKSISTTKSDAVVKDAQKDKKVTQEEIKTVAKSKPTKTETPAKTVKVVTVAPNTSNTPWGTNGPPPAGYMAPDFYIAPKKDNPVPSVPGDHNGQGTGNAGKNDATYNIDEPWKNSLSSKYGISDVDAALLRSIYGVGNDNNFSDGLYSALPKAVQIKIDEWKERNKDLVASNPDLFNTKYSDQVLNYFDATKEYTDMLNALDNAVESKNYLALGALILVGGGITNSSDVQLKDQMVLKTNVALDEASKFLGKGYKDMGGGRFVSADGTRQVRLTDSDITTQNNHAGAPHFNFETLEPNPSKPGKMRVKSNMHIFLGDK